MPPTCDVCGESFGNAGALASHRRSHGDADPDPDASEDEPEPLDDPDDEPEADAGGGEIEIEETDTSHAGDPGGRVDPDDVPADPDDPEALDLEDDDDAKDYNCGNCGGPVEYLGGEDVRGGGKKCPNCGERLLWSEV